MSIRVQTEAEAVLQSESRAAGFSKDTNRDQAVKPSPSAFPSLSLCGTLSIIVKGVREGGDSGFRPEKLSFTLLLLLLRISGGSAGRSCGDPPSRG